MASNESLEQELQSEFEQVFRSTGTGTDVRAAGIDFCRLYRLVSDETKKKLGDWIEQKLGKFARFFYDILIAIADQMCPA